MTMVVPSIFQQKRWSLPLLAILLFSTILTAESLSSAPAKAATTLVHEKVFAANTNPLPETVDVLIAGGGLGGLAVCIGLRRRGINAHVIEASETLLRGSTGTGIMISPNGFRALDAIAAGSPDLSDTMRRLGAEITQTRIRYTEYETGAVVSERKSGGLAEPYGLNQYNIGWARAHEVLAACVPPEAIHTGCRLESYEAGNHDSVRVRLEDGRTVCASLLIGADGFGSRVRQLLAGDRKCQTRFNGQLLWNAIVPTDRFPGAPVHGQGAVEYVDCANEGQAALAFDAGEGKTSWYLVLMERDAPEIVKRAMEDGSFGGFGPRPGVKAALKQVFEKWPMAVECLEATPEDQIFERRQADRKRLRKWSDRSRSRGARGRVVLMGDAAHPMIPSRGQGTMVTWEDAAELGSCLAPLAGKDGFDTSGVPRAVRKFVRRREKRCAMIQDFSWDIKMGKVWPKFFPLKILKLLRVKKKMGLIMGHTSTDANDTTLSKDKPVMSSSTSKAIDTNSVLPAYQGGSDLESFLVAGQRALLNNDTVNKIPLQTKVCIASTLKEFYGGQPEVSIDEVDGTIHAVIHAFVEPLWEKVEHAPKPEVSMAFVRDKIVPQNPSTDGDTANELLERLESCPTVALKMIRREAIEELWSDYQKRTDGLLPENEKGNKKPPLDKSSNEEDEIARAKSGDADAACRINKLAVEWAIRAQQTKTTSSAESINSDCTIELVCEDDRVLATSDASLQYVQSRISYGALETTGSDHVRLWVQSPSLSTPYRYERERGTGCTYCKVVAPRTIANALARYRCVSSLEK